MKEYRVCFTQYHYYTVTAENEDEAIELAEEEFDTDMHRPIANSWWDGVEVWDANE